MPPPSSVAMLASSTGRAPQRVLCALCARVAARRITVSAPGLPAVAAAARRAYALSASALPARPMQRHVRPLSQSSRTPPRAPPPSSSTTASDAAPSSPASSSGAASSSPSSTTPPSSGPSPLSFYELFPKTLPLGPPPAGPFDIDVRALRSEFLRLQAAAHPDFHHDAGAGPAGGGSGGSGGGSHSTARARAEALSSLINEAYRTLATPLLRAQYLLRHRYGMDLAGDESTTLAAAGGSSRAQDMELLMAVLEVREDIESATAEADLDVIRAANDARMRASEAALAAAFAADDAEAARREAVRLRYWVNIDDALRNWERGKDIVLEH